MIIGIDWIEFEMFVLETLFDKPRAVTIRAKILSQDDYTITARYNNPITQIEETMVFSKRF